MKLEQEFMKAKDEDELYHPMMYGVIYRFKRKDMFKQEISGKIIFSSQWEIIPAGPKVLTDDEVFNKAHADALLGDYQEDMLMRGIILGDKNGQLKQWLNHKPLFDLLTKYVKYNGYLGDSKIGRDIIDIVKNLKQPE